MFGEAFDGRDDLLGSFTKPGEMDSVFYFSQKHVVYADIFEKAHDANAQRGTSQIAWLWSQRATNWSNTPQPQGIGLAPSKVPVNFIDNHDTARFLNNARGDVKALRNALTLLLTEEGLPCVYYGTELDFAGGNDPANREVLWTTGFDASGETWQHLARLNALRKQHVALRRGDTKVLFSTQNTQAEEDAGLFAFERSGGDAGEAYALVVLNTNGRHTSKTRLMTSKPSGTLLADALTPGPAYTVGTGGVLDVELPAQSAIVLVPR
jgi:alpha-amylase